MRIKRRPQCADNNARTARTAVSKATNQEKAEEARARTRNDAAGVHEIKQKPHDRRTEMVELAMLVTCAVSAVMFELCVAAQESRRGVSRRAHWQRARRQLVTARAINAEAGRTAQGAKQAAASKAEDCAASKQRSRESGRSRVLHARHDVRHHELLALLHVCSAAARTTQTSNQERRSQRMRAQQVEPSRRHSSASELKKPGRRAHHVAQCEDRQDSASQGRQETAIRRIENEPVGTLTEPKASSVGTSTARHSERRDTTVRATNQSQDEGSESMPTSDRQS